MKQELAAAKNQSEKAHLVAGASPTFDSGAANDQEILDEAGRVQAKSKSSVQRMLKQVAGTEELAASTMETMTNQTEQLSKIHSDLEEMDSTLKLADAQIKAYMRKMATDKVILSFLFLIVVGFVVILGLKFFHVIGDDKVKLPDSLSDKDSNAELGRRLLQPEYIL